MGILPAARVASGLVTGHRAAVEPMGAKREGLETVGDGWTGRRVLVVAFLLAVVGTLAGPATAAPVEAGSESAPPQGGDSALVELLQPILVKHDLPAMAAAVVTRGGLVASACVGVRKRGSGVPVTPRDLWHLGSDTKAMTAALIGRWVERGKLRWDSRVSEVFPELAPSLDRGFRDVTLLQLLSHRAGLRANLDWSALARRGTVIEQRLEAVQRGLSGAPEHPPGSAYLYSNLGYVIAGAMLERVAGMSWEQAMRVDLFEPLGMGSAGFGGLGAPGEIDQPWGHASGGQPRAENGSRADNPPVLGPAGTVHATLEDWAKFVADLLRGAQGESGLLQPETYVQLLEPPYGGDYALGWLVVQREWGGGRVFNHCGCNTSYYANAWLAPRRDFAVLVCANQGLDAFAATDAAVAALVEWQLRRVADGAKDAGASGVK